MLTDAQRMRALWLAVLERAILDGDVAWLESDDFRTVADLAGLEPGYVASKMRAAMAQPARAIRYVQGKRGPAERGRLRATRPGQLAA